MLTEPPSLDLLSTKQHSLNYHPVDISLKQKIHLLFCKNTSFKSTRLVEKEQ